VTKSAYLLEKQLEFTAERLPSDGNERYLGSGKNYNAYL
jgi:hypothetical protein